MQSINTPRDIPPKGTFSYPLFVAMRVAQAFTVTFTWLDEKGRQHTASPSLSLQRADTRETPHRTEVARDTGPRTRRVVERPFTTASG